MNLYYNLSLASGGSGTTSNPYGLSEWRIKIATPSEDILYTKGIAEILDLSSNINFDGVNICPWYSDTVNGINKPWCLVADSAEDGFGNPINRVSINIGDSIIKGGMIQTSNGSIYIYGNSDIRTTLLQGAIALGTDDGVVLSIKGCSVISPSLDLFYPDESAGLCKIYIIDSILKSNTITIQSNTEDLTDQFELDLLRCAVHPEFIDNQLIDPSIIQINDTETQYNYGPGVDYLYRQYSINDINSLDSLVILDNINYPPRRGTPPYVGYETDPWNNPRHDIGFTYDDTVYIPWVIGYDHEITWSTEDFYYIDENDIPQEDSIKLEISYDGGENWSIISEDTPNDGSYVWTVAGSATDYAMIKYSGVYNTDISATTFEFSIVEPIYRPRIVNDPDEGESIETFKTNTITIFESYVVGDLNGALGAIANYASDISGTKAIIDLQYVGNIRASYCSFTDIKVINGRIIADSTCTARNTNGISVGNNAKKFILMMN